jgi:hypothetical protein
MLLNLLLLFPLLRITEKEKQLVVWLKTNIDKSSQFILLLPKNYSFPSGETPGEYMENIV